MKKTLIIVSVIVEVWGIFAFPLYDLLETGVRAPMLVVLSPLLTTVLVVAAWTIYLVAVDKAQH